MNETQQVTKRTLYNLWKTTNVQLTKLTKKMQRCPTLHSISNMLASTNLHGDVSLSSCVWDWCVTEQVKHIETLYECVCEL